MTPHIPQATDITLHLHLPIIHQSNRHTATGCLPHTPLPHMPAIVAPTPKYGHLTLTPSHFHTPPATILCITTPRPHTPASPRPPWVKKHAVLHPLRASGNEGDGTQPHWVTIGYILGVRTGSVLLKHGQMLGEVQFNSRSKFSI